MLKTMHQIKQQAGDSGSAGAKKVLDVLKNGTKKNI